MRHPFDLDLQDLEPGTNQSQSLTGDLEFEEAVSPTEAEAVGGGFTLTTLAIGEEGGHPRFPRPKPQPTPPIQYPVKPIAPPVYTTLAIGEEGGCFDPPEVTTKAFGEEGGDQPAPIGPPEVTTLAIGEEGGDCLF